MYFPQDEYESRWRRLEAALLERGLEAAVIWGRSGGTFERYGDVLYLTNFYSTTHGQIEDEPIWSAKAFAAVIARVGDTPWLITDEPYTRLKTIATDHVDDSRDPVAAVAEATRSLGLTRIGFVGTDFFPLKYWDRFRQLTTDIEWIPVDDLLHGIRMIKSRRELDAYREGGEIASRALELLIGGLVAGHSEAEAAAAAAAEVIRSGGNFHMIPVNHGDTLKWWTRSSLPTWSLDAPVVGDMVRGFVLGPIWQGYWLDPGRTAVCGRKPSVAQRELLEASVNIVDECIRAIAPGVRVLDVADLGTRMTDDFGSVKDQIADLVPLFGHGVGMFWEHPFIGADFLHGDEIFESGMVCGVEAFLGREGVGSTAFEQNIIVTDSGTELITTTPMLWH